MSTTFRAAITTAILVLVAGCSSSNDNNPSSSTPLSDDIGANNVASIDLAGLWNVTRRDLFGLIDIRYAHVTAEGVVTEYDYDQDEAGTGDNCYIVSSSTVTHIGGNRFSQTARLLGDDETFVAINNENELVVSFVDVNDDNENFDITESITRSYPKLLGVEPIDFTVCS